jgi:hypothetical protein
MLTPDDSERIRKLIVQRLRKEKPSTEVPLADPSAKRWVRLDSLATDLRAQARPSDPDEGFALVKELALELASEQEIEKMTDNIGIIWVRAEAGE